MTEQDTSRQRYWCGYCRKEIIKARSGDWYHIRNSSTSCNPQASDREEATAMRSDYEYTVSVPAMYDDDVPIMLAISAHGGGTVGREYASNGWDYAVTVAGETLITGSDLRSAPARAAGHAEMCRTLAGFLGAAGESLHYHDQHGSESEYAGSYDRPAHDFLVAEYERLSMFALDGEE